MNFNNKTEAFNFLKEKHDNNQALTPDEEIAVNEFFTSDELADMSFVNFNIEDCFNSDPTDI